MLPKEDRFAAPHTPRPRYGEAAPRTSFRRVAAHWHLPNPLAGASSQTRAGALEHGCEARRLTRAWSWRRPAASVEFHL